MTVGLILFGAAVTLSKTFVFNRISCWLPAELKRVDLPDIHRELTVGSVIPTTFTPVPIHRRRTRSDARPKSVSGRSSSSLKGSIVLVLPLRRLLSMDFDPFITHGLVFLHAPRLFWRSFNTHCGIDIQSLIGNSQSLGQRQRRRCSSTTVNR